MTDYTAFFRQATGTDPYPYQVRFASEPRLPALVSVPTGAGKTATVLLGWLWRRRFADEAVRLATPRRLIYCLPMRVLVEQTVTNVSRWLTALGVPVLDWSNASSEYADPQAVGLAVAMGGEPTVDWDVYPEVDTIVVGTQDMLLSRALNRGYGASRYRWPLPFAWLNNDALWVHDEVQLMGDGLATSAQLAGLRRRLGAFGSVHEIWMSATVQKDWVLSYDMKPYGDELSELELRDEDLACPTLGQRLQARKVLRLLPVSTSDEVARELAAAHRSGQLTLAVVNTVGRAVEIYQALKKELGRRGIAPLTPEVLLLHSRFRPLERRSLVERLLAPLGEGGRIVVSTQVIEAGVDVSAATLFSELAPWPSLVQRLGRCNRYGEFPVAQAVIVDLDAEKSSSPYEAADLVRARQLLSSLGEGANLSPLALRALFASQPRLREELLRYEPTHVLRRRDLLDLFDTTPDLAGNGIDVSRFVRDRRESDTHVFWRERQTDSSNLQPEAAPLPEELCPVPIAELRRFVGEARERGATVAVWDYLARVRGAGGGAWVAASEQRLRPGLIYRIDSVAGGYDPELGWRRQSRVPVPVVRRVLLADSLLLPDADVADNLSLARWQTIADHSDEVAREVDELVRHLRASGVDLDADGALGADTRLPEILAVAARWHDRGKAHPVFQSALEGAPPGELWAKAPPGSWRPYERPGFRHELAGALAARLAGLPDLVWYLVGAHHGKVRALLRALPNEVPPRDTSLRYARGVWDGDELPQTPLGGGVVSPAVSLRLDSAEIGVDQNGQPSWSEAVIGLRDGPLGPFRLAFLEALLRSADMRVSSRGLIRSSVVAPQAAPSGDTTDGAHNRASDNSTGDGR